MTKVSPRILHCIPNMSGGGAERQLCYLSRGLVEAGCPPHVALLNEGPNWERLAASGAAIHHLSSKSNYDPRILGQLVRLMRREKPDFVQTWLPQMDVMAGLAAFIARVPHILSERGSVLAYPGSWKNRLRAVIGARARAIIANSHAGRLYWEGRIGPQTRIFTISNIIPFAEIAEAPRADVGLLPEKELILFAGRYEAQKNLPNLIAALHILLPQRPNAVAMLCGEGSLRAELLEAARNGPAAAQIRIEGYSPQLWGLVKRADVFVSVSLFEGIPNTVLEACASCCPVVVSNIPEHREFLDESNAILVAPGDPLAIAAALERVLADPQAARHKAQKARQRVEAYSLSAITQSYVECYAELQKQA